MRRALGFILLALGVLALGGVERPLSRNALDRNALDRPTEVVVSLASAPLAYAPGTAARLEAEQRTFRRALAERLPDARVRWRYRLVANGFSVVLPATQVPALRALPAVRDVSASTSYGPQLDITPRQIGATALWGPGLETAGQGMKIAILDTGVDQSHPFFDPTGYVMPPGFPKGQVRFTSSKVIVARVFPPPGARQPSARLAFDPFDSSHGTHVAGIAAGNPRTRAVEGRIVSGVAPRAYIGSYKVFVETDSGISPNANSPAIVAAIEAAVADGMDVINFSGGEPEIEPRRDIVARALDAAAAAGVVPVIAAGNDYKDAGAGSVSSPGNSARAITVAAVETSGSPPSSVDADFSSVGPTTISLRMKPDVAAPGVGVLSSVSGGWSSSSGTSMASPHAAGAAALLAQRHPTWTVEQIKSALVQTGTDATDEDGQTLGPQFQGGGVISLTRADRPLLFAAPTGVSLGLLARGSTVTGTIRLEDAGEGVGTWQVAAVREPGAPAGARISVPATVDVPGVLEYDVATSAESAPGDLSGYIELRRGADLRRVPFWGRVTVGALARHKTLVLRRAGTYRSTTAGRAALVSRYRYPENPRGLGAARVLRGPELVYRFHLTKRVANFGVVVTQRAPGSRVEPRVVAGLEENRLTGYAGLPIAHNPYLDFFQTPVLAAGALLPVPGDYAIVFDSVEPAGSGRFTFRFWINDVSPPTARLRRRSVVRGRDAVFAVSDSGSGVFPESITVTIDGRPVTPVFGHGLVRLPTARLAPGKHRVRLRVSDYQETKNTENVARILPNTRLVRATLTIRPR
jgi:subtilisin family serine protease